jgi:hypothetical protein
MCRPRSSALCGEKRRILHPQTPSMGRLPDITSATNSEILRPRPASCRAAASPRPTLSGSATANATSASRVAQPYVVRERDHLVVQCPDQRASVPVRRGTARSSGRSDGSRGNAGDALSDKPARNPARIPVGGDRRAGACAPAMTAKLEVVAPIADSVARCAGHRVRGGGRLSVIRRTVAVRGWRVDSAIRCSCQRSTRRQRK